MFCEKCGNEVEENCKFCESCGNPISSSRLKEPRKEPEKKVRRKKLSKTTEIIILVSVICLVVVGNIFIFKEIFFKNKNTQSTLSKTNNNLNIDEKEGVDKGTSQENNMENKNQKEKEASNDTEEIQSKKEEKKDLKHTYKLIQSNLNWEEAKAYCESLGGYLATITSKEEEATVLNLLENSDVKVLWLGANDLNSVGNFKWINGEDFSYANWAVNEPNNNNGVEHYLVLYKVEGNWLWNDGPLNTNEYYKAENIGFVCEWEVEE